MKAAEQILKDMPSIKQGLDNFYGEQTVLNALNLALKQGQILPVSNVNNTFKAKIESEMLTLKTNLKKISAIGQNGNTGEHYEKATNFKYIQVISYKDQEAVKVLDVTGKSDRQIDLIDRGLNRNLNHHDFYTLIVDSEKILTTTP